MIRLLLVDDQKLFREGVSTLLSIHDDVEIVGEASDGQQAIDQTNLLKPDVILMDLRMPGMGGVAATKSIKKLHPESRVIVLTTFDDDESIFDALRAGAVGYLLKDVSSQKLIEAIRITAAGGSFLQPSVATKVLAGISQNPKPTAKQQLVEPLSKRELEILKYIGGGSSNREIANELFLSEGTVKNHVTNILGKMGVRDRTQAALMGKEMGLI
ncbi:MAG: response regulator transcription factor [Chloroflexota bacterium]